MKASAIIEAVLNAAPKSGGWMMGEAYGAYNVDPDADVKRILYCVTPTKAVIEYFKARKYDLLVSHHPFVAGPGVPQIVIHTALDCASGGLNDQWAVMLGIKDAQHFDGNLGWYGEIEPISFDKLCKKIRGFVSAPIQGQVYSSLRTIKSVVVCTGLGGMVDNLALASGADCYIVGEATKDVRNTGFKAYIEVGHTLTERMPGVNFLKALFEGTGLVIQAAPLSIDRYSQEVYVPWTWTPTGGTKCNVSSIRDVDWEEIDEEDEEEEDEDDMEELLKPCDCGDPACVGDLCTPSVQEKLNIKPDFRDAEWMAGWRAFRGGRR